jgi:hypothetical protein
MCRLSRLDIGQARIGDSSLTQHGINFEITHSASAQIKLSLIPANSPTQSFCKQLPLC